MTDIPRIDQAPLDSLARLGKPTLVVRMIDLFLETAPGRRDTLRTAMADGNLKDVERTVHTLKSSAGQLGGVALRESCQAAEDSASGDASGLAGLVTRVEDE